MERRDKNICEAGIKARTFRALMLYVQPQLIADLSITCIVGRISHGHAGHIGIHVISISQMNRIRLRTDDALQVRGKAGIRRVICSKVWLLTPGTPEAK